MKSRNLYLIFGVIVSSVLLVILFTILIIESNRKTNHIETNNNQEVKPDISYFKDKRTNLCFCVIHTYSKASSTILVPCDSVKNELSK
jgi:hypothetical protein